MPKLPLGKAKIRFFTQYLGYKSKEIIYPENSFIAVTFSPPMLNKSEKEGVFPKEELIIYGDFKKSNPLFFKINNTERTMKLYWF